MKKRILGICLCLIMTAPVVFAEEDVSIETEVTSAVSNRNDFAPQLVEKIKMQRNAIYNALNLTPTQIKKVNEIENCRYRDLEPELRQLCLLRKKLKDLNSAKTCDKAAISATEHELSKVKKNIRSISNKYDKEFKKVLTSEQESKYNMIRKLKRADLRKVEKAHKNGQKQGDLRPFGQPISQATYSADMKKQNNIFHKVKDCFKKK